ncbi:aminoacyl-tRNA hydrolase [Candidatus Saccharibacteria bacterium]|nr:aminoacyl-tRNA hydrolase [Candidatus Saccharibacteria bacterium]
MGLFEKKIIPLAVPNYTLGHQETVLIVGLGNIGAKYTKTRHNMGFLNVDDFALREEFNPWVEKKDLKCILCARIIGDKKVILCKPTTMMNMSGEAIQAVQKFYRITDKDTCVVYDELDLPFGSIRTGSGGKAAGHNGVKSLISTTENGFWRIRVGIGPKNPPEIDSADFVLQNFKKGELEMLTKLEKEISLLLHDWISGNSKSSTTKL